MWTYISYNPHDTSSFTIFNALTTTDSWGQNTCSPTNYTNTKVRSGPLSAFLRIRAIEFREWVAAMAVPWAEQVRDILRSRPCLIGRVTILFQPRWSARRWRSTT